MTSNRPTESESDDGVDLTSRIDETNHGPRSPLTRRAVLAGGAATLAATSAGCIGGVFGGGDGNNSSSGSSSSGDGGEAQTTTQSSPKIASFGSKNNKLLVTVAQDSEAGGATLVSPQGDQKDKNKFDSTGQAKLSLVEDGDPITAGRYTVKLVKDDWSNVLSESTIMLNSHPKVTNVKLVGTEYSGPVPQATITNTGRLPAPVEYVGFRKNVPKPFGTDGIFEEKLTRTDGGQDPLISKGEKGTFKSQNHPFYFDPKQEHEGDSPFDYTYKSQKYLKSNFCQGNPVDTTLEVIVGGQHIKFPVTITYGGDVKIQDAPTGQFVCSKTTAKFHRTSGTAKGSGGNATGTSDSSSTSE